MPEQQGIPCELVAGVLCCAEAFPFAYRYRRKEEILDRNPELTALITI